MSIISVSQILELCERWSFQSFYSSSIVIFENPLAQIQDLVLS